MKLMDLKQAVPDLAAKGHADLIKLFGWFLHTHQGVAHFVPSDIRGYYEALHLAGPSSFGGYLDNLLRRKELLRNKTGYRLENRVRETLDRQFGTRSISIQVAQLLVQLPAKMPNLADRTYLDEALICYKNGTFRAAVVMTWNLAYHHLCNHILAHHLAEFNSRWMAMYSGQHKRATKSISKIDDFAEELKESEVIEICNAAGVITKDIHRILKEKRGRRNSAAHPSDVTIGQLQAEDFIDDLVKNVVLKLT